MDCFLCSFNAVDSTTRLLHLSIQHDLQKHSIYKCGFAQCFRSFQNLFTFKKHLKTHSCENITLTKSLNLTETITFDETTTPINEECISSTESDFENVKCSNTEPPVDSDHSQIENLPKVALVFASGLYADMHLSRSSAAKIIDDVKTQITDVLCNAIIAKLSIITQKDIRNQLVNFVSESKKMFDRIDSEYKFNQIIKNELSVVELSQ